MRVCPKCEYVDPAIWRSSIAHREIDFCKFEDFSKLYPDLAQQLINNQKQKGTKNFIEDKHYAYHLTKGQNVERQAKLDNPTFYHKWLIPVQASPHKRKQGYVQCIEKPLPKTQTKLFGGGEK